MHSSHLSVGSYAHPPWNQSTYINYLEFFYMENFHSFPFIHIFNNLVISVWTCGYLFHILGHDPKIFYLSCFSTCSRFCHWKFLPLSPVSFLHTLIIVGDLEFGGWFSLRSLLSAATRCSRIILRVSFTTPRISYFFISFIGELENDVTRKIRFLNVVHAMGGNVASSHFSWQNNEINVLNPGI